MRRGAAALGVPIENLPDEEDEETDVFEVWDINWPVMLLFLGCETQWRCVSRGLNGALYWLGIDYGAAQALIQARSRSKQRSVPAADLFEDLRFMEIQALAIMNEVPA